MTLLATLGCGTEPAGPIKSRPTEPTVAFPDPTVEQAGILWTDLETLFPPRPAALPEALATLVPGTPGARAREVLEAAHEPGIKIFGEMNESDLVLSSILAGMNTVQISVVLAEDATVLTEVHVELPDDVAVPMLDTRWGKASTVAHVDGGQARYTWQSPDSPWEATLYPAIGPDRALVRYVAKR